MPSPARRAAQSTELTAQAAAERRRLQPSARCFSPRPASSASRSTPAKFAHLLAGMAQGAQPDRWAEAAKAIMTTDTYPKVATATVKLGDVDVTINGIAKGAGMIAPDMATMLSFVVTDAPIAAPVLQALLSAGIDKTLQRGHRRQRHLDQRHAAALRDRRGRQARRAAIADAERSRASAHSARALDERAEIDLALQVVRDGEGARKQVEVTVTGAKSARSAKRIALSIANSPLVKTAVAGEDANWGRVVMAVGKAGEPADRDRLSIWFGDNRVAARGRARPGLFGGGDLGLHEARGDRDPRRYRPRPRQGDGLDLRPDQGICRHQRRLPELTACRDQQPATRRWRRAPLRGGRLPRLAGGGRPL